MRFKYFLLNWIGFALLAANAMAQDTASYEGFTEAIDDALIGSEEVGRLIDVPVKLGEEVVRGQVLAKFDDMLQVSSLELARGMASMTGELDAALATAQSQRQRVEQLQTLAEKSMAGSNELIRAETDLRIADAKVRVTQEQREQAIREVNRYEIQLRRRVITAPFDGVIAQQLHSVGETVTPADPFIVRLVRIDVLEAVFNIPAEQIQKMRVGDAAEVYLRAARRTVSGRLDAISPIIDGESGTIPLRVRIENPDRDLRPGDRCTMRWIGDNKVTGGRSQVTGHGGALR